MAATCTFASDSSLAEAEAALREHDYAGAKALVEPALASERDNARAHFLLGLAEFGLKNLDASEKALSNAIKLDGTNADFYAKRARTRIERAQEMSMFTAGSVYMKSLEDNQRAVELDPDYLESHIGLARYYSNAPAMGGGSMKKAKAHAAEVLRIDPYLGHIELALIADKENRTSDAIAEYQAAIALNAADASTHFELGKIYQASGHMLEAKGAYEAALRIEPEHAGAKAALAAF